MFTDLVHAILMVWWVIGTIIGCVGYFWAKLPIEHCLLGAILWPVMAWRMWRRRNERWRNRGGER